MIGWSGGVRDAWEIMPDGAKRKHALRGGVSTLCAVRLESVAATHCVRTGDTDEIERVCEPPQQDGCMGG